MARVPRLELDSLHNHLELFQGTHRRKAGVGLCQHDLWETRRNFRLHI